MEILKIWDALCRRRKLFWCVFLVFFLTIALWTLLAKPVYRGRSVILVETTSDPQTALMNALGLKTASSTSTASSGDDYATDIELAKLRPLLDRIVSTLELKGSDGKALKGEKLVKMVFFHKTILPQPCISVDQYEDASMMKIDAYSTDPEEAAEMSNRLAEYYLESRIDRTKQDFAMASKHIEIRIADARMSYRKYLADSLSYKLKAGIVDIDKESTALIAKLSTVQTNYEDNEKSIIETKRKLALDLEKLKSIPMYRKASEGFAQNENVKTLKGKLNDAIVSMAAKSVDITKYHPDYRSLEKQVDAAKDVIKSEAKMVLDTEQRSVDPVYDDLYKKSVTDFIDKEASLAKRKILKQYIDDYQKQLMQMSVKSHDLSIVDNDASVYKDNYLKMLSLLTNLKVAESVALSNIAIVERAVAPENKYFPVTSLLLALGLFLGLCFAIASVLFMEYTDDTIRMPQDIRRSGHIPFAGMVPYSAPLATAGLITQVPPTIPVVDGLRTVKNSISFGLVTGRAVSVTSAFNGEGRTTVAANVAILYAQEGKRVILADFDVLKPSVHQLFNISGSKGISDVLSGGASLQEAIAHSSIKGLDLIPCGTVPADPAMVVFSEKLGEMLRELKTAYDVVIIDTPPTSTFNGSFTIGHLAGQTLLVIESGKVRFNTLDHVEYMADRAGTSIIGAVLNKNRT